MEERIRELQQKTERCEEEIGKAIIGQKEIVRQVLLAVLTDGNVLLEGVPGLGKTQLVKTLAQVLDLSFSRIQFTPDLMPADVTGTNLIVKKDGQNVFQFEQGPVFANIVLADEINRATPKTQSALLEAMQEKTVTVGKETYHLPKPFMVLATQNPLDNEGTYPLPEAQLDRFLFQLKVSYPTLSEMKQIMAVTVSGQGDMPQKVLTGEEIIQMRGMVKQVLMAEAVEEYALKIVLGTHPDSEYATESVKKYVVGGASPRAAQAICSTARARALLEGRYNVAFEDIDYVALPALRHRLLLNFDAISEGVDSDTIIRELLVNRK